jgi:hypothetical protein
VDPVRIGVPTPCKCPVHRVSLPKVSQSFTSRLPCR